MCFTNKKIIKHYLSSSITLSIINNVLSVVILLNLMQLKSIEKKKQLVSGEFIEEKQQK